MKSQRSLRSLLSEKAWKDLQNGVKCVKDQANDALLNCSPLVNGLNGLNAALVVPKLSMGPCKQNNDLL